MPDELATADLSADNGIRLDNGLNLANGFVLRNGIRLANGIRLSNGVQLRNGLLTENGINLSNGVRLANGIRLANGVDLSGDVEGPFIAPAAGSDLEAWLDDDPANNVQCSSHLCKRSECVRCSRNRDCPGGSCVNGRCGQM